MNERNQNACYYLLNRSNDNLEAIVGNLCMEDAVEEISPIQIRKIEELLLSTENHIKEIREKLDRQKKDHVVLTNSNGVELLDPKVGHITATNALCGCGSKLIVAPKIMIAQHQKGNPIMVCTDHAIHAYWFNDLVKGVQPTKTRTRDFV